MKKILLIGLASLALVAMLIGDGMGVAAFLQQRNAPPPPVAAAPNQAAAPVKAAPPKPSAAKAHFVKIDKFVVTVPGDPKTGSGPVYLQLALSLLTESNQAASDFGKLEPIIKSQIISDVMASGSAALDHPIQLKHKIAADALVMANATVSQSDDAVGKAPFLGAYVTTFITQ